MYINTYLHIYINIKAEHPPVSPLHLLLLKLVTELAGLFRSGYSPHTWHRELSSARAEQPGRDVKLWVMEADLGEQPGKCRKQGLEMALLAPRWHSGLPELASNSRLGDGMGGWLHQPIQPLNSPSTLFRISCWIGTSPHFLGGVPVCPSNTCMLVTFGSTPHHSGMGLFAFYPQSHLHCSLPLLSSP